MLVLYYTVLQLLYYTTLYYTTLYYTTLYYTVLYYTILYYTVLQLLYSTLLYYAILDHATITKTYYTLLYYYILIRCAAAPVDDHGAILRGGRQEDVVLVEALLGGVMIWGEYYIILCYNNEFVVVLVEALLATYTYHVYIYHRSLGVVSDKIASAKRNPVQTGNSSSTTTTTTNNT